MASTVFSQTSLVQLKPSSFSLPHKTLGASMFSPLPWQRTSPNEFSQLRKELSPVPKMAMAVSQKASISPAVSDSKSTTSPIIVIDNYDSFTYNLCQYMGELGCSFEVYRNDELTVEELKSKNPRGILISPGPGAPQDSAQTQSLFKNMAQLNTLFSLLLLFTLSMSGNKMGSVKARRLVETLPEIPKPELPEIPKPTLPELPITLPKPELPSLPEFPHIPELPKPTLPTIPGVDHLPTELPIPTHSTTTP